MFQNQNSFSDENSKNELWVLKREEINYIADKLGKGIDEGIKDTVTVLQLLGIHTRQSCEGHLNRGVCAPWIDILCDYSPAYSELKRLKDDLVKETEAAESKGEYLEELSSISDVLKKKMQTIRLKEAEKMVSYLTAFYSERIVPYDRILTLSGLGTVQCRLQSIGANLCSLVSDDRKAEKLAAYQQEVGDFTTFLKEQFFT